MIHLEYAEQGTDLGIAVIVPFLCGCGDNHEERIDKIVTYADHNWLLPCLLETFEKRILVLERLIYEQLEDPEGNMDADED